MKEFLLYRFVHSDGSAKEWAYCDLGAGQAEIRWGPRGRLQQSQRKPIEIALDRARKKVRKGYVRIGTVWLDDQGQPTTRKPASQPATPPKPVDLKSLLGGDDGFYF